jgi:hypothetical protein
MYNNIQGNQWVKKLNQNFFNSSTGNVRTETYSSATNQQDYNDFKITLTQPLHKGEVAEVSMLNMQTNWLPQSNILQKTYTTQAKVLTYGAFFTYQGFPFGNSGEISAGNGKVTGVPFPPAETNYQNGVLTLLCGSDGSPIKPSNYLPVPVFLTVDLTFFQGSDLSNQYLALQSLGSQLSKAMNTNTDYGYEKIYNNFFDGTEDNVTLSWLMQGYNGGSSSPQYQWQAITTEKQWYWPIGEVESNNGNLGIKTTGFMPIIGMVAYGPSTPTDPLDYVFQIPCFYGIYYTTYFDFQSSTPFSVYSNGSQIWRDYDYDMIYLSRLFGFPSSILCSGTEANITQNSRIYGPEYYALGRAMGDPQAITYSFSSGSAASTNVYPTNFYVFLATSVFKDSPQYELFNYPASLKYGLFNSEIQYYCVMQSMQIYTNIWTDQIFNDNKLLNGKEVLIMNPNNYYGNWLPQVLDNSIPPQNIYYNVEGGEVVAISANETLFLLYNSNSGAIPAINQQVINNILDTGTAINLQYELVCSNFVPDYFMDSKLLSINLRGDFNQYGGALFDGRQTSLLQQILTLNANPYGAYQSNLFTAPQNIISLFGPYDDTFNSGESNEYTLTINTVNLEIQSESVNLLSAPNFMPISESSLSNVGQPIIIAIEPRDQELTELEIVITNSLLNKPNNIMSLANIKPYTQITLQFKIFSSVNGLYNQSILTRAAPINSSGLYPLSTNGSIGYLTGGWKNYYRPRRIKQRKRK